jgi:hypothetical protein
LQEEKAYFRLHLQEDVKYNWKIFKNKVGEEIRNLLSISDSDIEKYIKKLFENIKKDISTILEPTIKSIKEKLRTLDIESPPPKTGDDWFSFGQWVGFFKLSEPVCGIDTIIVEPKVEKEKFKYMINEALGLPAMIGFESLNIILTNFIPYRDDILPVLYSDIAYKYTEMALRGPLPRIVEDVIIISEGQLGRIDVNETLKLKSKGTQLIASHRSKLNQAYMPMMLIAKFHYMLLKGIDNLISKIENIIKIESIEGLSLIKAKLELLKARHSYILTSTPISAYLDLALSANIEDSVLIRETRARSGVNTWLKAIADLYESYNSQVAGVEPFKPELPLQLIPSSKVFELWALRIITEALGISKGNVKLEDAGLIIEGKDLKLHYNTAYAEGRLSKELRSRMLIKDGELRPDYRVERRGEITVADAKYKDKLSTQDMERIITYIVDIATPLKTNGDRLVGVLILLTKKEPKISNIVGDKELTTKHELRIVRVNPSEEYKGNNVEKVKEAIS